MDKEKLIKLIKDEYPNAEIKVTEIEVNKPDEEAGIAKMIDATTANLMGYDFGKDIDMKSIEESAKAFTYVLMKIQDILKTFVNMNELQLGYEVVNESLKRMLEVSSDYDFDLVVMPRECDECNNLN